MSKRWSVDEWSFYWKQVHKDSLHYSFYLLHKHVWNCKGIGNEQIAFIFRFYSSEIIVFFWRMHIVIYKRLCWIMSYFQLIAFYTVWAGLEITFFVTTILFLEKYIYMIKSGMLKWHGLQSFYLIQLKPFQMQIDDPN